MVEGLGQISLKKAAGYYAGRFQAMASPCEILVETDDEALARRLTLTAEREAKRIESKFSRYRTDNIVHRINHSGGKPVEVDAETANLLDYADTCFRISGGLFDITTGVLRRVWKFDGSDRVPNPESVAALMEYVGWTKVGWHRPQLTLPVGMELDLGGIGKEYAVDSSARLIAQHTEESFVVNYGGDLYASGLRRDGKPWRISVSDPRQEGAYLRTLKIRKGAIATSGDARRFLEKEGVRYSHILDPQSGWPIPNSPRSVTVAASTCLEAGTLSTLALLHGADARAFLEAQNVEFWVD